MKLEDIRETYQYSSGKVSDIVRYLGLAGIAVIWMFKTEVDGIISLPTELLWPTYYIIVGLALDLIHYIVHALIYFGYFLYLEKIKKYKETNEFLYPEWMQWVVWTIWILKIIPIIMAYFALIEFFSRKINSS